MSRLIFSRRAIQQALDNLSTVVDPGAHGKLVTKLNSLNRERLSTVWEVAVLSAIASFTSLTHEAALPSGKRPDFATRFRFDGTEISVVGDVATVSDAQLHADNPFEALTLEIDRLARKHRLQPHHFREDVRGGPAGDWPKQKMVLHLPPRAELVAFLKARVEPFIRQMKAAPHEPARIDVKDAGVDFTISYDPARRTGGAGHTSYDRALSLTENPIYTALENKRRRGQLRGAPEAALRMIVLCDAGCASIRDLMNPGTTHDADAIAMRFLQSTSSIDLVVLMTVERTAPYAVRSDLRLKVTPIGSPQAVA